MGVNYLRDTGLLLLYCFLTLFQTGSDFFYILAFLTAVILCCADYFLDFKKFFFLPVLLYFTLSLLSPFFLCFFPAVSYVLLRHRSYPSLAAGLGLFLYFFGTKDINFYILCIGHLGLLIACVLQKSTSCYERLEELYRRTRDDSTELNLLLTERNHTLLEKQDYEIYTATLKERNRIAREIHDNVGHLLSRSILITGALQAVNKDDTLDESLRTLDASLNSAMDSIRSSVHDLHDESINLEEAVNGLIKDFIFCPISFHYDMGREIPKEVKYCFISITKEALANIMRHSNADYVQLYMREHPGLYQLCIEDNGNGTYSLDSGIGLINMKERVHTLKGNIQILTEKGFKIFITIPKGV
ncbi:sensor histidine kinase [Muricomes intestini]|uniref:sensor histidine kinase n=1 Tax=Muricomes intestini TaxID=1796634 RepID=UPI002FE293CF